ncbi:MBL fold metallo-hydrolase [Deinococcus betulae]|uniref:MBL fold metallo-hydrolase n=1 Tax=Deinococcus betulae TaxID=2873312 RepID=UPI00210304D2|nr:MBL fold metallo-hydrolase [Deinococcus betulae]
MLHVTVLGRPAADNALLVSAESGQGRTRLLLDCGAGTAESLPLATVQEVDHLLLSHLHMDHISGFDAFFRVNFDRQTRENHIWGPPGTARILHHRFQGFWWNHAPDLRGVWHVHDVGPGEIQTFLFRAEEAFAVMHSAGQRAQGGPLLSTPHLSVSAVTLAHHGASLGFRVQEPERINIDPAALRALGLPGGPWLSALKSGQPGLLDTPAGPRDAEQLRRTLLRREPGQSLAYLTDFLLDDAAHTRLTSWLAGVEILYAEAQYLPEDADLAARHHHTTADRVARLAADSGVGALRLLHLSRRYAPERWPEFLTVAQEAFAATAFPDDWTLSG